MKRSRLAALGACLAIGAATVGVAVANSSDSPEDTKSPEAVISLLKHAPNGGGNANPFASELGKTLAEQGGYAINAAAARAVTADDLTVWVAPNDRKDICTAVETAGALAVNCAPSTVIATNGLFSTSIGAPGSDQTATVVGVVPDGITQVRFNGLSTPVPVADNVVAAQLAKAPSGATLVSDDGATAVKFGGDDVR